MKYLFKTLLFLLIVYPSCSQNTDMKVRNVAVFVYEGVEILDFGGPSEVFAASGITDKDGKWQNAFNVYIVAESKKTIKSQGFIQVIPEYTISDCPKPDIIVLPGGDTRASRKNPKVKEWLLENSRTSEVLMSVCTGAFLLGDAGLLDGKKATTWYGRIDALKESYPNTSVIEGTRFVDNGNIVTTAGVSAGIDGALHIVSRLLGHEAAAATAKYMEYDKWEPSAGMIVERK